MSNLINVKIKDGKNSTYKYRKEIANLGFRFIKDQDVYWEKNIPENEIKNIEKFCNKHKLSILFYKTERDTYYRENFFKNNKPKIFNKYYQCVYCGKLMEKDKTTVDHLVPVKLTQVSQKYRKLLDKNNCKTVNDINNLVPACMHCNTSKGAKAGMWIIRGKLGKSPYFWLLYRLIQFAVIILIVFLSYKYHDTIF